jgi:hypothetical protein
VQHNRRPLLDERYQSIRRKDERQPNGDKAQPEKQGKKAVETLAEVIQCGSTAGPRYGTAGQQTDDAILVTIISTLATKQATPKQITPTLAEPGMESRWPTSMIAAPSRKMPICTVNSLLFIFPLFRSPRTPSRCLRAGPVAAT